MKKKSKDVIITLEGKKLSSMGPDTIVIIPRKIMHYKILSIKKKYDITFREHKRD